MDSISNLKNIYSGLLLPNDTEIDIRDSLDYKKLYELEEEKNRLEGSEEKN